MASSSASTASSSSWVRDPASISSICCTHTQTSRNEEKTHYIVHTRLKWLGNKHTRDAACLSELQLPLSSSRFEEVARVMSIEKDYYSLYGSSSLDFILKLLDKVNCWILSNTTPALTISGAYWRGDLNTASVQWRSNDDFLRPISDQQSLHVTFW